MTGAYIRVKDFYPDVVRLGTYDEEAKLWAVTGCGRPYHTGEIILVSPLTETKAREGYRPWARMREHGPCMIFDWHATQEEAREAINAPFQTVAYFPGKWRTREDNSPSGNKEQELSVWRFSIP